MSDSINLSSFLARFPLDRREDTDSSFECSLVNAVSKRVQVLKPFFRDFGGCTFGQGLYRVHRISDVEARTRMCVKYWPELDGRALSFASDWTGRQFALDAARDFQVLFLDADSGDVFRVPMDLVSLHNEEMVSDPIPTLDLEAFEEWTAAGHPVPGYDECVGYKVPAFLGGEYSMENRAVQNFVSHWGVSAQAYLATKNLPEGTPIEKVVLTGD